MTPLGSIYWKLPRFVDSSEVVVSDALVGTCTAFLVCCPRSVRKLPGLPFFFRKSSGSVITDP